MLCPNCRRENQEDARFCIFCGTPLQGPAAEEPRRRAAVNEEIASLREMVSKITERLDALEKGQPSTPLQPPLPEIPAIMPVSQPEPKTAPVTESAKPPVLERPPIAKEREWEQILGGSWLARIGVIALIIGIGFPEIRL